MINANEYSQLALQLPFLQELPKLTFEFLGKQMINDYINLMIKVCHAKLLTTTYLDFGLSFILILNVTFVLDLS